MTFWPRISSLPGRKPLTTVSQASFRTSWVSPDQGADGRAQDDEGGGPAGHAGAGGDGLEEQPAQQATQGAADGAVAAFSPGFLLDSPGQADNQAHDRPAHGPREPQQAIERGFPAGSRQCRRRPPQSSPRRSRWSRRFHCGLANPATRFRPAAEDRADQGEGDEILGDADIALAVQQQPFGEHPGQKGRPAADHGTVVDESAQRHGKTRSWGLSRSLGRAPKRGRHETGTVPGACTPGNNPLW